MRGENPGSNRRNRLIKKKRTIKKAAPGARNTLSFFIFAAPVIMGWDFRRCRSSVRRRMRNQKIRFILIKYFIFLSNF
jgi:hypothetical protein